jgi:hypothetical protein
MNCMTRNEFVDALQKGQGRAVLQIKEHGVGHYKEELLNACLHNLVYDTQCEPARDDWLLSMIDLTANEGWYWDHIIAALNRATERRDISQLMHLAEHFARRGSEEARQAIYARFDQSARFGQEFESTVGGEQIVELDGIMGIVHVAEITGGWLLEHPESWEHDYLIRRACERLGTEAVMTALETKSSESANVRAYLSVVQKSKRQFEEGRLAKRPLPSLARILADIDAPSDQFPFPGHFTAFGKKADPNDLQVIFDRLLAENARDQLLRCLWVFRRRALPSLHPRLFELAQSDDEQLQQAAIAALAHSKDPRIHELALRLFGASPAVITGEGIHLFVQNYEPGDHQVIEKALFVPSEPEERHSVGYDILDLAKSKPAAELGKCLEWVYEHTPCSNCRGRALNCLIERSQASEDLLTESLWDCCEKTRAAASKELNR